MSSGKNNTEKGFSLTNVSKVGYITGFRVYLKLVERTQIREGSSYWAIMG